mmetsp:Transcript_153674/g.268767  ORF Transcript_153674/g.268767 Transcript_153674/m.268767 type:complete len:511 (+) Transcript_153674:334-1866(+)
MVHLGGHLDAAGHAGALHAARHVHGVPPQVEGHDRPPNDAAHHGPHVKPNALIEGAGQLELLRPGQRAERGHDRQGGLHGLERSVLQRLCTVAHTEVRVADRLDLLQAEALNDLVVAGVQGVQERDEGIGRDLAAEPREADEVREQDRDVRIGVGDGVVPQFDLLADQGREHAGHHLLALVQRVPQGGLLRLQISMLQVVLDRRHVLAHFLRHDEQQVDGGPLLGQQPAHHRAEDEQVHGDEDQGQAHQRQDAHGLGHLQRRQDLRLQAVAQRVGGGADARVPLQQHLPRLRIRSAVQPVDRLQDGQPFAEHVPDAGALEPQGIHLVGVPNQRLDGDAAVCVPTRDHTPIGQPAQRPPQALRRLSQVRLCLSAVPNAGVRENDLLGIDHRVGHLPVEGAGADQNEVVLQRPLGLHDPEQEDGGHGDSDYGEPDLPDPGVAVQEAVDAEADGLRLHQPALGGQHAVGHHQHRQDLHRHPQHGQDHGQQLQHLPRPPQALQHLSPLGGDDLL